MPTTSQPRTGAILTADMINGWKEDAGALEAKIQKDQQQLVALRRRLDAVAVIMNDMDQSELPAETPIEEPQTLGTQRSVTEAIPRILRMHGRPLKPSEIRDALRSEGFDDKQLGPYFYTVMMRLSNPKNKKIIKFGKRYKAPNPTESETADNHASNGVSAASNSIRATDPATPPLAKEAH